MSETAVKELTEAYSTDAAALQLGAAVIDGEVTSANVAVPLSVLNRHGLIAGATGTGKTKTLQLITEQLSAQGVPVFVADVKGDLSGVAVAGTENERIAERAKEVGQNWEGAACPTEFYALGGKGKGIPVRSTITAFGPQLLAKILDLSEVQSSSLAMVFHFADQNGLPLLDLKDLRAVIQYLTSDEGKEKLEELGGLSKSTAGVLLRELTAFAGEGADLFFGEPEFESEDLMRTTADGRGIVSCLELAEVSQQPALFSTFLMWLLADLFEVLPEAGDLEKPKLVFFFDEAHLLFKDAPKELVEQISQTVRLIRSKGVGIFFVTQHPTDLPDEVLAQLGSRVQHALRAFTPADAKALKATVATYPTSEIYDVRELLTSVGIGEAVVTVLNEKGAPTPVAWTKLPAPTSLMAPAPDSVLDDTVKNSSLLAKYGEAIDRESAYEKLMASRIEATEAEAAEQAAADKAQQQEAAREEEKREDSGGGMLAGILGSSAVKSFMRTAGREIAREVTRSILGTGRRRR